MSQSERHALVLGGGTMGVGIIAMFLGGGWKVDVVSRSASTRDGLPAATAKALAAMGKPDDVSGLATYATLRRSAVAEDRHRRRDRDRGPRAEAEDLRRHGEARPARLRAHLEFLELPDQRDRQGPEDARAA